MNMLWIQRCKYMAHTVTPLVATNSCKTTASHQQPVFQNLYVLVLQVKSLYLEPVVSGHLT